MKSSGVVLSTGFVNVRSGLRKAVSKSFLLGPNFRSNLATMEASLEQAVMAMELSIEDDQLTPVSCHLLEADRVARRAYRDAFTDMSDPEQVDLSRWHDLEMKMPGLFGRMHVLYCRHVAPHSMAGA